MTLEPREYDIFDPDAPLNYNVAYIQLVHFERSGRLQEIYETKTIMVDGRELEPMNINFEKLPESKTDSEDHDYE